MEDQKPCHCPLLGCDFVASSEVLSNHFSHKHGNSQIRFSYGHNFVFFLKSRSDDETIVLHEENDGKLFILKNKTMFLGNVVIICCIGPNNSSEYSYDMMATSQKCKLKLQSFAKNITQFTLATLSSGFLVIPFSSSEPKLEICIKPVPMMQIIIKMLDQREFPLSVKSSETIDNVMQQIFDKEGIPCINQRLIFSGKQLEHSQTLADCNIKENSTIYLGRRLMGS
ncbi:E3 ubiquitin-protein ligase SINA [Trifolium repens]|nr:E3 ubiquitin-protein ligase SINA [Trifolium repens]